MPRVCLFFFLMIRRPPRSTLDRSSAASDVYKRQVKLLDFGVAKLARELDEVATDGEAFSVVGTPDYLSLIHISEPTRPY